MDTLAAARLLLLVSVPLLFGLAAFALYALHAAERRDRALIPLRAVLAAIALIGVGSTLFGFLALGASMTGTALGQADGETLVMLATETPVGIAAMARAGLLSLALVALLAAPLAAALPIAALCGGIATASLAWGGHAMMLEGASGWIHLAADIVHLLAAGVWTGAIAGLFWLLPRPARASANRTALAHRTLERFSFLGTFVVLAIILTGAISYGMILGWSDPATLFANPYRRMLAGKLAIFVAVIGLASANRYLFTPLLLRDPARGLQRLRLSIGVEGLLILAILALVAMLGASEP